MTETTETTSPSPIHPFYRLWFTRLDPIMTAGSIYITYVHPEIVLASLNPTYRSPPGPETIALLDLSGALFCVCLLLQLGLLRARPADVVVWHYYAVPVGLVDVIICAAILRGLSAQGRLAVQAWRVEEWMNLGLTAACAVVRAAFVLRIGVGLRAAKADDDVKSEEEKTRRKMI
ncbi:hypothetical protein G647_01641 [Cladophialophora carrionii CBS 160.54]|uniref:DUF7704 domain-containing protein n=1 Tax=Cladophialophora carrionii CBS 160.54 TaxID=1279043 RepID=V9DS89_9EURO|nr:uncharacterized protein G647_01641 [Cladophialophora carrionii CBS 160.54]ETI29188.1 hypothetical protein G647_01641 [Cladophialophora carrionii CBS 160.54]